VDTFAGVDEKRRHKRVESSFPVQYRNLRKLGVPSTGTVTRNLSEGGVCFKSNEFISLACRLVVEVALPNSAKPIKAISKVAWIRKTPSGDQYELGNQFLEITKEDRAAIVNFVNQAAGSNLQ
jgi:c-di-GMP-binding flagellar brake protein YcgR